MSERHGARIHGMENEKVNAMKSCIATACSCIQSKCLNAWEITKDIDLKESLQAKIHILRSHSI